jgi:hypothetical protein
VKTLNFFPFYERYLVERNKTTTFRLSPADYQPGERVRLTVGWDENTARQLHDVVITSIYQKPIQNLNDADFEGESPDCKDWQSTVLVLSSIYHTIVSADRNIWIVKFRHCGHN